MELVLSILFCLFVFVFLVEFFRFVRIWAFRPKRKRPNAFILATFLAKRKKQS